eukprot:354617-Chlamydomonas_euryale.AAC.1
MLVASGVRKPAAKRPWALWQRSRKPSPPPSIPVCSSTPPRAASASGRPSGPGTRDPVERPVAPPAVRLPQAKSATAAQAEQDAENNEAGRSAARCARQHRRVAST